MRISGVTGDLPAVAAPTEPPAPVSRDDGAPPPAVAPAPAATAGGDAGSSGSRQQRPPLIHAFDPPLIAQRAALGLPVGMLIAQLAEAESMTYSAACAAVDRAMPED